MPNELNIVQITACRGEDGPLLYGVSENGNVYQYGIRYDEGWYRLNMSMRDIEKHGGK
jgi:hypothetical protein